MKVSTKRFVPYSMRGKPLLIKRNKAHNLTRLDLLDSKRRDLYFLMQAKLGKW